MKIDAVIPSFGRLDCFERCVTSLSLNKELGLIHVFPDVVTETELKETREIMDRSGVNYRIHDTPPKRLYGCRNQIRSVRVGFQETDCDYIVRVDSDMLCSKNMVSVLLNASRWLGGGVVISKIVCEMTQEEKRMHAGVLIQGCHSGSNIIWPREAWMKMSSVFDMYEQMFMMNRKHAHSSEAAEFLSKMAVGAKENRWNRASLMSFAEKRGGTVGDALTHCVVACSGIPYGSLLVNRLIHLSDTGENTTPEFFRDNYSSTTLNDIEGDSERVEFVFP